MSIPDSPRGRSTWRDSVPKSPRPQKCRRRKLSDWTGICNTSLAERIWWNWLQDQELYPDWSGFAKELEADGVHLLTYVNPFLMKDAGPKGELYREAERKGCALGSARTLNIKVLLAP
eukprot:1195866-Prorocentrum_minimum.AAC.8